MIKLTATRRDFIFLILLIVMVRVALNKKHTPHTHPVIYAPANYNHDNNADSAQPYDSWADRDEDADTVHREQVQEEEAEELADEQASGDMSIALDSDTQDSNVIHEPDKHIMYHLNTLLEQIDDALIFVNPTNQEAAQIKGIRQRLVHLKHTYQHTSPAIVLLGPIGSTGIVFKEQELENELLRTAHRLETMLYQLVDTENKYEPTESLAQALENNKLLLAQLHKSDI